MPNWCENDLRITGSKEELKRFKTLAKSDERALDEQKFIPYPPERERLDNIVDEWEKQHPEGGWANKPKDWFNHGGYEWCLENYGTKWGICEPRLEDETPEELFYQFRTAWSAPLPIIQKMGEMFPKLTFDLRYFEGGMGFNGCYQMENGECTMDASGEYYGTKGW